ncbi:2OG-Fe dioxygenase family protein [Peristeroidobacter soli]|uniref:2OG-Fe dioxygenase family protein n=1 Tax=Peristeroidobacter soli TaxID=2497877 RepID=UPI00101D5194|nr:2OG-Fe dioxygenase family protein [Peristeroidobacter soli]
MKLSRSNGDAATTLHEVGCVLLQPDELAAECRVELADLGKLAPTWNQLPRDAYLRDGGRYRSRRHSCFIQEQGNGLQLVPHRAHWQPTEYNALHGGMERWFEPMTAEVLQAPAWNQLISGLARLFARARPVPRWYIEAHQFRIDTAEGIGRPTPEGAHRDGVDYVAVILVNRFNVRGGETRVFEAEGTSGVRFTMSAPWSALLLDDAKVIHETTPIQNDGPGGVRDTLVVTFRERGFQAPGA